MPIGKSKQYSTLDIFVTNQQFDFISCVLLLIIYRN